MGAITGLVVGNAVSQFGAGCRQLAQERANQGARDSWHQRLARARGRGDELAALARQLADDLLATESREAQLKREVEDLRRAVAQRETVIRSLASS